MEIQNFCQSYTNYKIVLAQQRAEEGKKNRKRKAKMGETFAWMNFKV